MLWTTTDDVKIRARWLARVDGYRVPDRGMQTLNSHWSRWRKIHQTRFVGPACTVIWFEKYSWEGSMEGRRPRPIRNLPLLQRLAFSRHCDSVILRDSDHFFRFEVMNICPGWFRFFWFGLFLMAWETKHYRWSLTFIVLLYSLPWLRVLMVFVQTYNSGTAPSQQQGILMVFDAL